MEKVAFYLIQFLTLAVLVVHGCSVIHIVRHQIRMQPCFVSKARLIMHGLQVIIQHHIGLVILTCHPMEEGKVLNSMAGLQDAHLPSLIG